MTMSRILFYVAEAKRLGPRVVRVEFVPPRRRG